MKERPILFSAPMVRAILAGTKTQTRRVAKLPHHNPLGVWEPQTIGGPNGGRLASGETIPEQGAIWHTRTGDSIGCPHGQPGDLLWVRETWRGSPEYDWAAPREIKKGTPIYYEATKDEDWEANADNFDHCPSVLCRPSIFMPRWACRILLEITSVRVERLQEISEADAQAEGIERKDGAWWRNYLTDADAYTHLREPRASFSSLWVSINGDGSWDANPWVWVVEFRRVQSPA